MLDLAGLDIGCDRARTAGGSQKFEMRCAMRGGLVKRWQRLLPIRAGLSVAIPDTDVENLIPALGPSWPEAAGSQRYEILDRILYPMINEGARILEEGIASRAGDIDVVWLSDTAWPIRSRRPHVLCR